MAIDARMNRNTTAPRRRRTCAPLRSGIRLAMACAIALSLLGGFRRAEASTIALRDGTTISGEIVSLNDGVYVIRSATLGTVNVKQADVATVTEQPAAPATVQLDALQERIAADPAAVAAIAALQDDPDVQAVLSDPALLAALRDGNLEALLSNPKLVRLATDPRVQDISRKFTGDPPPASGPSAPQSVKRLQQ